MEDMTGVLIVEDQFLVALDLEHIVASAGYPVVGIATARSEIEALAVPPKIAFVDINLRDGPTGVEIARALAERFGTRIIFVTKLVCSQKVTQLFRDSFCTLIK